MIVKRQSAARSEISRGRDMRTSAMTAIMLKHGEAIIKAHYSFFSKVYDILPTPKWSSVAGKTGEKSFAKSEPLGIYTHAPGCECCTGSGYENEIGKVFRHIVHTGNKYPVLAIEKDFPDGQIDGINDEFEENVGKKTSKQIDKAAQEWEYEVAGKNKSASEFGVPAALFKIMLFDTIIQAMVEADIRAKTNHRQQPESWRDDNPMPSVGPPFFDPKRDYIKEIYERGYTEVTAKITKEYLPLLKQTININLNNQRPWNEIAYTLAREVGEGKVWHWARLVRTEMARAIGETKRQRFGELGVDYVKYSATYKRCPICDAYASYNDGYYKRNSSPMPVTDTHPNCTCDLDPIYNLPMGVNQDGLGDAVFIGD